MAENFIQPSVVENANAPAINARQTGTVIKISINDDNIDQVIDAGYNKLLLERSTDNGLSWLEITGPGERAVLAKGIFAYSITDRGGDPNFLYRTRYVATQGSVQGECSDPSEPIEGAGLAIRSILTVPELKNRYFFGVDLTNDKGEELTEATFTHYILQAIRWLEHELDMPILPTAFLDNHDYNREDYQAFSFIQLDNYPVIQIDEFRVQYPSGQNVIVYPAEWIRLNKEHGQIQIVPTAGTLSEVLIGQGGSFLPAIYNGMQYLPHLFQVAYVAGFEEGRVPRNIIDLIGMAAALGPLDIFGDLLGGAGIASLSLSMDGLSQSLNTTSSPENAGYGARVIQYQRQIKAQIPMLRRFYKGLRFTVG